MGVTGFSWFAAVFEVTGAALFAAAGAYSLWRTHAVTEREVRSRSS
jgi:hypothetical protein